MISRQEIRNVVEHGEIIEDYPNDARGHSCLMLGSGTIADPSTWSVLPRASTLLLSRPICRTRMNGAAIAA
jgi:hypothetical protein